MLGLRRLSTKVSQSTGLLKLTKLSFSKQFFHLASFQFTTQTPNNRIKLNTFKPSLTLTRNAVSSAAVAATAKEIYKASLFLFGKFVEVADIKETDVEFGYMKTALNNELHVVSKGVDALRMSDLLTADTLYRSALDNIEHGNMMEADRNAKKACDLAISAFNTVSTFKDKVHATQLRILCLMLFSNYFECLPHTEPCNIPLLRTHCHSAFNQLCATQHVQSALKDRTQSDNYLNYLIDPLAEVKRHNILYELSTLNAFFRENLQVSFPLHKQLGHTVVEVDLSAHQLVLPAQSGTDFTCLEVLNNLLYVGCKDSSLVVYDLKTFARQHSNTYSDSLTTSIVNNVVSSALTTTGLRRQQVGTEAVTSSRSHGIRLILAHDNYLCVVRTRCMWLYSIDRVTNKLHYIPHQFPISGVINSLSVVDNTLHAGTERILTVFDKDRQPVTHIFDWDHSQSGSLVSSMLSTPERLYCVFAMKHSGDTHFIVYNRIPTSYDNNDTITGDMSVMKSGITSYEYAYNKEPRHKITTKLLNHNNLIYYGLMDGSIAVCDDLTLNEIHTIHTQNAHKITSLYISNGVLYVGFDKGSVMLFDIMTRKKMSREIPSTEGCVGILRSRGRLIVLEKKCVRISLL